MQNLENYTNGQLVDSIIYGTKTERNQAGTVLATKNPTNSELTYIMRYCSDADLRNQAWTVLATNCGIEGKVDEEALIKEIAIQVLDRPGSLNMGQWHCGTSHCLAGWACIINPEAKKIENSESTEIAGAAVLPSYAHLFYSDNNVVLELLKTKV